jgi:hypothetical protein
LKQFATNVVKLTVVVNEFNWGQININSQSKGAKAKGGSINGVRSTLIPNPRLERLRGAERFLVLQYEEAPLSLAPL